jgi:HEAT repeat protein
MKIRLVLALAALLLQKATAPGEDVTATRRGASPTNAALPGIVFVGAPIFDPNADGGDGVYQGSYHWRDGYIYPRSATYHRGERTMGPVRPGRNLYSLVPACPEGKLTRLTHLKTGAVFKPEPSYDGRKILFAIRRDGEDWFHLSEMNVDGTCPRQLTDGPFNDFAGVYLPDGRIVFCSDRTGYLEEYHEERTETLFVMNGDSTEIKQLTFAPGTYFEPSVMRDGRILFSFWDAFHIDVPPFDKHETYLMTVNPDGTEERHLFGAGQYRFFNRERHSGVGLTQAHEMPDGRILVQSEMGPSLIDLRAGLAAHDALTPVFPGTTSIQLGGTTHRVHLSPLGTRSTPYPLQDGRFLFSATLPGARDSGIYVCDPDTREEKLVINIPDYAEFDAVPVLVARTKPAILPVKTPPKPDPLARFLIVAGRVADNPERAEALKRARYFRVIEAEYTGVTTSSHTNLETRNLGTVPILEDGSSYFEAPADTPLFLDPIDAGGNRVLMEWGYPSTSVKVGTHYPATQMAYMVGRPGETRACYGCHATQTDAVPNTSLLALKYGPVRVTRDSTDLEYRRNEPEAYRRQARIGEAQRYRPWLSSKDPMLRARACEMLMYIEDGAESDRPQIVKLLEDGSVEVRRAAALALTRLATADAAEPLRKALKDSDWLVRYTAKTALEAIGCVRSPGEQNSFETLGRQSPTADVLTKLRAELAKPIPDALALRAAGKLKDAGSIPLLAPWLKKHEWEYHAAEAAIGLGRIGTREAVKALWNALESEVPIRQVHISRYLQHGPRPEEYALLKGLILAEAKAELSDVHLLIALLPGTFQEKPRFEDRMRRESQRVLMPRLLLGNSGFRKEAVSILWDALNGRQKTDTPLHSQILKGINLERPFSEHGRPFPVVKQIGAEEALWLLGCLMEPGTDLGGTIKQSEFETRVVSFLTSENHRERIDAAVLLGLCGFGPKAAGALIAEIHKPYAFPEISSIGKGMPDPNFRDKAYFVMALAQHVDDVSKLTHFSDPIRITRDIRYGLTHGLAFRGKKDGIDLLLEMARRDPITLVRQQARYAIADILDACRIAGEPVPQILNLEEDPLEKLYPPRPLTWPDARFVDLDFNREIASSPGRSLREYLTPENFRNLNNAQATGAQWMMTAHVEETRLVFEKVLGNVDRDAVAAALNSSYPFAHYLAAAELIERPKAEAIPQLIGKLDSFGKTADTVGLWWCCEALGRLKAKEALPTLSRYATGGNLPGTFGPEGMPTGYIAAKAIAQIVADTKNPEVVRLLEGRNIWLKAGALRGLAEARASGVETLLREAADEANSALVRHEAAVQLRRLHP